MYEKERGKKMNYYICPGCRQRYCGWSDNKICQKCGGVLKRISQEEFYLEKKRVVIVKEV
ncbi:hypothetical protein ES705_20680 [subsurface metagenome]